MFTKKTLVSGRTELSAGDLSSGSAISLTYRSWHPALASCSNIVLVYSNKQLASGTPSEVLPASPITIKASVEQTVSVPVPATFYGAGGRPGVTVSSDGRTVKLAPGAEVESDPIALAFRPYEDIFVRTQVTADTLGDKWPVGLNAAGAKGEMYATADFVDATSLPSGQTDARLFRPSAILGTTPSSTVSALISGSSTARGQGDSNNVAPSYDRGWLARSLYAAGIPYTNTAVGADSIIKFLGSNQGRKELIARVNPSFVAMSLGHNDITSPGIELSVLQSRYQRILDFYWGLGLQSVVVIGHPILGGTEDGYTTVRGQHLHSAVGLKEAMRDWVYKSNHPGIVGILDTGDFATAPGYPDRIKVDGGSWMADNIHLNSRGHANIADFAANYWRRLRL